MVEDCTVSGRTSRRRVLITGITGFVGSHFAEYALSQGADVWGSYRHRSRTENIDHIRSQVHLVEADLRDATAAMSLLEESRPHYVIHLAAHSFVGSSWTMPHETLANNLQCQVNLLEGILAAAPTPPRFLVIGSSEEYGLVERSDLPIKETQPLRPLSPYAVSKVAQNLMGYQYHQSYGMPIIRARAFNHEGPRRGEHFVTSNFARQVAQIEAGGARIVRVGNLEAVRDYTDVRDIVRGYWTLLENGSPGEVYNLCSGVPWSIQCVLNYMTSHLRNFKVEQDTARMRPSDVPILVGDASKAKALGWEPKIPFTRTLDDTLDFWRARVKA